MSLEISGPERRRSWLGAAGALFAALVIGTTTGRLDTLAVGLSGPQLGWIVALGLMVTWYLLPPEYTFAVGHLALGTAFATMGIERLVAFEVGLVFVLLGPAIDVERMGVVPVAFLAFVVSFGAIGLAGVQLFDDLRVVTVLLATAVVVAVGGLKRYEFVSRTLAEAEYE